jgi:hypothetical protein
MVLYSQEIRKLRRIISIAEKLIAESPQLKRGRPALMSATSAGARAAKGKRLRRTGEELIAFRKMLKAERKKGDSVAGLAKKHGVSRAYIYLLR